MYDLIQIFGLRGPPPSGPDQSQGNIVKTWACPLNTLPKLQQTDELWSMDIVTMDIMIYDSTGSLQGSTGWYLMLLGQYGAILVVTCCYWVSMTWYWLVLSCTGLKMAIYCPQGSGTLRQQYTLLYSALLCFTLLYTTLHCSTLLYSALHCSTLLYSALLCSTLLYSALLCSALL